MKEDQTETTVTQTDDVAETNEVQTETTEVQTADKPKVTVKKKPLPAWLQKAIAWCKAHKLVTGIIAGALVAVIVTSSVLGGVLGNKFRAGKVEKIELGYTHAQVEKVLGKPYYAKYHPILGTSSPLRYFYYPASTKSFIKKREKEAAGKSWWDNLMRKMRLYDEKKTIKQYEKFEKKARKEIQVMFGEDGAVEQVVFNKHQYYTFYVGSVQSMADWQKRLKTVKRVELSVDSIEAKRVDGEIEIVTDLTKAVQSIWYTDGSFERAYYDIEMTNTEENGETTKYMWSEKGATVEGDSVRLRMRTLLMTLEAVETVLPLRIVE